MIPASRVSTPVPVADLIANLDTFVRSVPLDSLRTVVDELGTGFTPRSCLTTVSRISGWCGGEFDPYTCERGYQGTIRRTGTDTTPVPANRNALCAEPLGSPTDVRGAQNVSRAGVPGEVAPGGSARPARSAVAASRPSSLPITSLTSILEG